MASPDSSRMRIAIGSGPARALLDYHPVEGADCLLFYPGTMTGPRQYEIFLAALRRQGLSTAALHFTGHGDMPHHTGFSFNTLLQNALDAEACLWARGARRLAVCGHSQGAILTLAHAALSSRLAVALPIAGCYPQQEDAILLTRFARWRTQRPRIQELIHAAARRFPRLPVPLWAYLPLSRILAGGRGMRHCATRQRWTYPLAFLDSLFAAQVPEQARCPVHMLAAVNDALFTQDIIRNACARLQAPRKSLFWLPGGGHLAVLVPRMALTAARYAAACCAGAGLRLGR
ncbi:MAG: alpha/beta hydrolase [Desulfovibrio sp.]|uniref:alpha/beta fold hydrolase n=1 Tax=Desulfovibrio sp. TaxID=885 RepID=UPI0025B9DA2B|nr:alpha/beta hydrolase [Desulfovibrio sp.]MCI7568119.1 alpha/beta hydrolase [Desulfovibrio sp.]